METRLILQLAGAVCLGLISAYALAPSSLSLPSSNIVTSLSIINAAIFPTVVLSATVLKGVNVSPALVERYRKALRLQISFFFGILLFSLMAIGTIIIAQVLDWRFEFTVPRYEHHFEWNGIFNFLIVFFASVVAFRLPAFFRAVVSLLDVHIDGVAEEAAERDRLKREDRTRELSELPDVSGHQRPPESRPLGS
ncbi:hypothetical protein [Brucella sp. 10RB9213]|uniref:hypothetical protein n=1 Tax=Brucella sp. 10RB9213 TaxID=1844039 RepID=UPI0012AE8083|nr:hypothetical protein [Brucella sp. 10RB9213]MRN67826.1 hypothetical protein [Brucella sp. 10RB9213]